MKSFASFSLAVVVLPCLAQSPPPIGPNRFQAGARLGFNVQASIGGLGGLPSQSNPGPSEGSAINRTYDDGYVRVDADGNAGGVTWNWGYRDASQVPGDDTLRLHSTTALGTASVSGRAEQPALGAEIAWLRDLHRADNWSLGTKVAVAYTGYELSDSSAFTSQVTRLTDVYSLGGILPPGDPSKPGYQYAGVPDLPGPVIDDVPIRREQSAESGAALITGTRSLDANIWSFKLGPWIELPMGSRFAAQFGGGFAFAVVEASLSYGETVSLGEGSPLSSSGSARASQVVFGGYVEALLNTHLTERLDLVLGAEFMPLGSYQETLAGRPVELEFGTAWALNLGFSFRF